MTHGRLLDGDEAGLVIFGLDYARITVKREGARLRIVNAVARNADRGGTELIQSSISTPASQLELRVSVQADAVCQFSFSRDGKKFEPAGSEFIARPGIWTGAKVGLFALAARRQRTPGFAEVDWFRVE